MDFWDIVTTAASQGSGGAPAASTYQRMLPNGADVSMTGTNQYVTAGSGGPCAVSETGS